MTLEPQSGTGGSGSSSGGSSATYAITVESAANGSVSASAKSAVKGAAVTVTVTPNQGYTLESLTVTDKNGNVLKTTDKGSGKYAFTMPDSAASVKAAFVEGSAAPNRFTDVPGSAYYYDAVLWAVENGVTSGTSASAFSPNTACTRAQAVTFLWRAAGSPAPKSSVTPFTDVAEGSYYHDAVLWAVENGVTSGTTATTFSPDGSCTRAQIVTFLYRWMAK